MRRCRVSLSCPDLVCTSAWILAGGHCIQIDRQINRCILYATCHIWFSTLRYVPYRIFGEPALGGGCASASVRTTTIHQDMSCRPLTTQARRRNAKSHTIVNIDVVFTNLIAPSCESPYRGFTSLLASADTAFQQHRFRLACLSKTHFFFPLVLSNTSTQFLCTPLFSRALMMASDCGPCTMISMTGFFGLLPCS